MLSKLVIIIFPSPAPPLLVQISNGGATPSLGEDYQLICSVSGAENLNSTIAYQWTKNSGSGQTQVGANSNTLLFTPLKLSDTASYTCMVTIASIFLTGDIVMANSQDIRIQGIKHTQVDSSCMLLLILPTNIN